MYSERIHAYETTLTQLKIEPYPIDIEKMMGLLVYKLKQGRKYTTLASYIASFSYYFRQNNLNVLTNCIEFKIFKNGLRRQLKGDTFSNSKLPFNHMWFDLILEKFPINNIEDMKFMFYMTLSFTAFLRISELLNLKKGDLELIENDQILKVQKQINLEDKSLLIFTILINLGV